MKVARRRFALPLLLIAALLTACCGAAAAQAPASSPADATKGANSLPATNSASAGVHGVVELTGPWRFQIGDDPRWADPAFDDSSWQAIALDQPLSAQGVPQYSGYGWYRIRLDPRQLALFAQPGATVSLSLFVTSASVGQTAVFINGVAAGNTQGMSGAVPSEFQSPPVMVDILNGNNAALAASPVTVAIRTWAAPTTTIGSGLLGRVELGTRAEIAHQLALSEANQWTGHAITPVAMTFLFLCVAALGMALYLAQKNHSEYLWLALLCLSVAAGEAAGAAFGLARISLQAYGAFIAFSGRVFMAVTLEFVLRFTGSDMRRIVRPVQAAILLLPFLYFFHTEHLYDFLSITAQIVFCTLVCIVLFRAWRKGRTEAGVMLLPFFLAATADSADAVLDFAAYRQWLPARFAAHSFHLGPVAFTTSAVSFTIFLASLVSVILYRFIRVSQDEQRSNAEIAAARSVQALLIPTQLPSTRNFMLESAYLPVNGVGGDFFQVLPLKDDSLLIVVGDVSGKGLQAAMNSSTLVGALRNELSHDPATVLSHLNHVLLGAVSTPGAVPELDAAPCFATCLCARIYPDGSLTIANAGHLSPYRDGRELELEPSLPLGVIAEVEYSESIFQLDRGDRLIFLSDGVVEATNPHGELFGFERTKQVSNESARYIAQTAQRFGQTDDITVVSLYLASRTAERNREVLRAN